jgi:nucleoside phosphorylase
MSRVDDFVKLLQDTETTLRATSGSSIEAAADDYELAGAVDLLKKFLSSGSVRDLNEGTDRLARVFARRTKQERDWGKSALARLRILGEELTKADREHALDAPVSLVNSEATTRSQVDPAECDLLVVAAMYEPELSEFLKRIFEPQQLIANIGSALPSVTYYRGTLDGSQLRDRAAQNLSVVGLFQDRVGMVDCSALVTTAVRVFRPKLVAMTGVCAGRRAAAVRLCDLVIPTQAFTYDTGKYGEHGFQPEPLWADAAERVCRRVVAVGDGIIQQLSSEIQAVYGGRVRMPKLHTQIMACGSAVVDHPNMMQVIGEKNRKVVGLDMESYAFLRALRLCSPKTPAFVVKGVMDLGAKKSDRLKTKAAYWAASFLVRFVTQEFESIKGE